MKEFAPIGANSFLLRVEPICFLFVFFLSQKAKREAKRESQKLLPFVKMVEKYSGIPINIKVKNGYTSRGGFKRNLTAILLGNSV